MFIEAVKQYEEPYRLVYCPAVSSRPHESAKNDLHLAPKQRRILIVDHGGPCETAVQWPLHAPSLPTPWTAAFQNAC